MLYLLCYNTEHKHIHKLDSIVEDAEHYGRYNL